MPRHQLSTQLDRNIKKLGSPAAILDSIGRFGFFYQRIGRRLGGQQRELCHFGR